MIYFIISDSFDYENYMPDDAGPRFASMYAWNVISLKNCKFTHDDIYLVDCYLDGSEFQQLSNIIDRHHRSLFVFHVVDPWPHVKGANWFQFLNKLTWRANVALSGPYIPHENIALLFSKIGGRFIHTPYLYEPERELPFEHEGRRSLVIVTGNIGVPDYPIRNSIMKSGLYNPLFWGLISRLPHPGYQMDRLKHDIVRDQYIQSLSRFRFAAVCSSRLRLEFLKYREIAYAGCAPVGDLPGTLSDCTADAFIIWQRNFIVTRIALSLKESEVKAREFRRFMAKVRSRDEWRIRVNRRLNEVFAGLIS